MAMALTELGRFEAVHLQGEILALAEQPGAPGETLARRRENLGCYRGQEPVQLADRGG